MHLTALQAKPEVCKAPAFNDVRDPFTTSGVNSLTAQVVCPSTVAIAHNTSTCELAMQAVRQAARQMAQRGATQLKSIRSMASDASSEKAHLDEAMKEMSKWRTVTYVAVPTCIAVAAWDLTHQHEHHEEVPDYPYMRIRSKDFPWGPCGLFEMHCPDAEGSEE